MSPELQKSVRWGVERHIRVSSKLALRIQECHGLKGAFAVSTREALVLSCQHWQSRRCCFPAIPPNMFIVQEYCTWYLQANIVSQK